MVGLNEKKRYNHLADAIVAIIDSSLGYTDNIRPIMCFAGKSLIRSSLLMVVIE